MESILLLWLKSSNIMGDKANDNFLILIHLFIVKKKVRSQRLYFGWTQFGVCEIRETRIFKGDEVNVLLTLTQR